MTTKEEIIEKVQKMKALAERGIGGEKENATQMVERMMEEYDITEDDLREDAVERRWLRFNSKDKYAKKLMAQIIYAVTGVGEYWTRGRKAVAGVECTAAQEIEIASKYAFYYEAYLEDLEVFYSAFINKNGIFPETTDSDDDDEEREIDYEYLKKVQGMMKGMEKHDYHKQLEV